MKGRHVQPGIKHIMRLTYICFEQQCEAMLAVVFIREMRQGTERSHNPLNPDGLPPATCCIIISAFTLLCKWSPAFNDVKGISS